MRFESQTHPQDDHIDRITDCSTRYGRAPAVALMWDWPREDALSQHCYVVDTFSYEKSKAFQGQNISKKLVWFSMFFRS